MAVCAREDCVTQGTWFGRPQGISVNDRWYCSVECVEQLARHRVVAARPPAAGLPPAWHVRLGVWLRQCGVDQEAVVEALSRQKVSRRRMGDELIALGATDRETVLSALAKQAGIGFIAWLDPSTCALAPAGLSKDMVQALNLVPFGSVTGGRVRVACVAPVPRVGMAAFGRLTNLVPEPYLVSDDNYAQLVDAYGGARTAPFGSILHTTDLTEAAHAIAAAAARDGHAHITETRLSGSTWIRVRGDRGTSDVVCADPAREVA